MVHEYLIRRDSNRGENKLRKKSTFKYTILYLVVKENDKEEFFFPHNSLFVKGKLKILLISQ